MTINDNSTKSINAAIIDLQNQIKQLQHKIGILNKNQLKEDDIEFPGKVEYADEAGKAKEADHAKTADTAKYTSETENAVHAGYADIATKATQDGSGNVITDTYATKTELTSGLSGKANTSHNHSAADITSGILAVERGGTGQTTQAGINTAFVGELSEGNDVVTDGTMFVSSWASDNGFADTNAVNVPYKRKFSRVWEYIKGKISSVLGITNNKHIIQGETVNTNTYADTNPKLVFSNIDGSQEASLTFTDFDVVQYPASITLNGNQGGEYFIAPNIKATDKFYGSLDGTATKAEQDAGGNVITDTYATKAELGNKVDKGEVGVPQVVRFAASNLAGSYELVRFGFRSAFRCVISGTCGNYAEAKIIDVIASSADVPQSNILGNNSIGPQGNFSFGGGNWVNSSMYWNKPLTEENVYYTVVLIPYSENNVDLVI